MISRASKSSILQGFAKSRSMLAGNEAFIPNSFESIATVTVGAGGSSTITFSSIPSTYKHLQIRGISRTSNYVGLVFTINSDTAGNYSRHRIYGDGTNISSDGSASISGGSNSCTIGFTPNANLDSNVFGGVVIDILDYANTNKYKTLRSFNGFNTNGGETYVGLWSASWQSTSAVTSILLKGQGVGFEQYTTFALYGIKGA